MVISWLTHHKPVPGFKYVERKPLTRNDDIHDKKRYQINTKVCQTFMLWNPFCIFLWEVLLYNVVKCHTGKKPSEIVYCRKQSLLQQMKQKSNSRKNSLFSILTNMTWGPYQKNFLDSYWPNKIFQIPLHVSLSSLTKSNINLDSMGPTSQTDTVMHKWLYLQTTSRRLNQWTAAPIQTIMFNSYSMGRIKIF